MRLATLGIASSLGCAQAESSRGPLVVRSSTMFRERLARRAIELDWDKIISTHCGIAKLQQIADIRQQIASWTKSKVAEGQSFVVIGGDHSSAMGTWSGAVAGLDADQTLGLIWIDAHLDLHNFTSSPSGNIHGMPLAALLNLADEPLKQIYGNAPTLDADNIVIIGTRSYETEEMRRLSRMKLECHDQTTIRDNAGLVELCSLAIEKFTQSSIRFGISIDLDAVDPEDAPGVSTPVCGGIRAEELLKGLRQFNGNQQLVGIEIAEFAPGLDRRRKTLKLIGDIIAAVYGPATAR